MLRQKQIFHCKQQCVFIRFRIQECLQNKSYTFCVLDLFTARMHHRNRKRCQHQAGISVRILPTARIFLCVFLYHLLFCSLPYHFHFIGSTRTCSFYHIHKTQDMIHRTDQTWRNTGKFIFFFKIKEELSVEFIHQHNFLPQRSLSHTDLSHLLPPFYFSFAKNILIQYSDVKI